MIEIPPRLQAPKRSLKGEEYPCVVCGEPVPNPKNYVHLVNGGGMLALPDEEVETSGDMGYYPIGTSCLRKHPHLKPYAIKSLNGGLPRSAHHGRISP